MVWAFSFRQAARLVAALFLFGSACLPAATPPLPTATVVVPPPQGAGCLGSETAEIIWPQLTGIEPEAARPGQAITITGSGGFVRCGTAYNESARTFQLFLDDKAFGQIGCYVNHCEVELTLPDDLPPGEHTLSAEGGSQIVFQVVGD